MQVENRIRLNVSHPQTLAQTTPQDDEAVKLLMADYERRIR